VQVVREDPEEHEPALRGARSSVSSLLTTAVGNWLALNLKNLPNVAIHDILVHARENDLILATARAEPLDLRRRKRDSTDESADSRQQCAPVFGAAGFAFSPACSRATASATKFSPDRIRPEAQLITYYLKDKLDEKADFKMQIFDRDGKLVQDLAAAVARERRQSSCMGSAVRWP
jgi:hypothetical protein